MKKLKINLPLVLLVLVLTSCASSFKQINPEDQEFSHKVESDDLLIEYNPNILKYSKNTKFQKRADRKNLSFILGKFTNKSSESINLSEDVTFNIQPKEIKDSYSKLKQRPLTYYLALISVGFTVSSDGNSGGSIGINPYALVYSIPNSIIASNANKKMREELNKYDIENKVLAPNESKYALITFENKGGSILDIETIKGAKVETNKYSSAYGSLLVESCIKYDKEKYQSYEDYRNNLIQCLKESKLVKYVTTYEKNYKNGNPKVLGLNAKHELGNNKDYLYKIGTWAFYNEDGTLEKLVEYDLNGKEI